MSANACARIRYGTTAEIVGPTCVNAASWHALAIATSTMSGSIASSCEPIVRNTPYAMTSTPKIRTELRGSRRNSRSP